MPVQFDVCRVGGLRNDSPVDLAVILQDDIMSEAATRVVAPMIPVRREQEIGKVNPAFDIDGVRYVAAIQLMTAVPLRSLGPVVANLRGDETRLKNAIDIVLFGV